MCGKWPPEDDERGVAGQRPASFICGFEHWSISLDSFGLPSNFSPRAIFRPVPSKWNDKLTNMWDRIHFVVVVRNGKY